MRSVITAASMAALLSSGAIASETNTYSYDARGRLVQVVRTGGPGGNFISTYALDDADNRTQVTITAGSTAPGSTGGTTAPSFPDGNEPSFAGNSADVIAVTREDATKAPQSIDLDSTGDKNTGFRRSPSPAASASDAQQRPRARTRGCRITQRDRKKRQ